MKKSVSRSVSAVSAGLLTIGLAVGGAAPAMATGFANPSCATSWYYAESGSTGARSVEQTGRDCGTMGARSGYNAYPGSPLYWTGWVYHSTDASVWQSTTVIGKHYNSSNGQIATT